MPPVALGKSNFGFIFQFSSYGGDISPKSKQVFFFLKSIQNIDKEHAKVGLNSIFKFKISSH